MLLGIDFTMVGFETRLVIIFPLHDLEQQGTCDVIAGSLVYCFKGRTKASAESIKNAINAARYMAAMLFVTT
jgi:hypothetical protein